MRVDELPPTSPLTPASGRSYRLGVSLVVGMVLLAGLLCVLLVRTHAVPAGESLGGTALPIGSFRLVNQSRKPVSDADLAHSVWVADFIFTRCTASCPRITAVMKRLQDRLADTPTRLASLSVDPGHDTPEILNAFARRYGADADRWWFLTGPKSDVYRLILDQFKIDVAERSDADQQAGSEAVSHSGRLVLVDRGNRMVGAYDSTDEAAVARLEAEVRRLERRHHAEDLGWPIRLPAVNASLNATCAVLLLIGWVLIRRGQVRAHAVCMIAAITISGVFLASYLAYHYVAGSVAFRGEGPIRLVYLTILLSHTVLAVAVVPLIVVTVTNAALGRFVNHARWARLTFPIWVYVSITGVVVYWMLYQMDFAPSPT